MDFLKGGTEMGGYPTERRLCGVFFRVNRRGRWCNVCFSDMTLLERDEVTEWVSSRPLEEQVSYWRGMAGMLADRLHEVGDELDIRSRG